MVANTSGVYKRQRQPKEKALSAIHSMATLAESDEIGRVVGLPPRSEGPKRLDVVHFKCLFRAGQFTATLASILVALANQSCLLWPIRAIVRLIAAPPVGVSLRVLSYPFIPAFSSTKATLVGRWLASRGKECPLAVEADFFNRPTFPSRVEGTRRPVHSIGTELLLGLSRFRTTFHHPPDTLRQITGFTPAANMAGLQPRRVNIERSAASLTGCAKTGPYSHAINYLTGDGRAQ